MFVFVLSLRYYVCDVSILSDHLIKFQDQDVWILSYAGKTFKFSFVFFGISMEFSASIRM